MDGQQLSVHNIQPGMTIERTTITTTTPRLITTIKTVSGTVWHVDPPTSVILTLENGKNQQFHIPDGTKFMIDGQPTDAFSLREGMKVSATAVTEIPETISTTQVNTTGEMPPPVETVNPDVALLVILVPSDASANTAAADSSQPATEAAAAAPAEATPAQLPKTGSSLSLLGLLGGLFCSLAIGLKARRAFNS